MSKKTAKAYADSVDLFFNDTFLKFENLSRILEVASKGMFESDGTPNTAFAMNTIERNLKKVDLSENEVHQMTAKLYVASQTNSNFTRTNFDQLLQLMLQERAPMVPVKSKIKDLIEKYPTHEGALQEIETALQFIYLTSYSINSAIRLNPEHWTTPLRMRGCVTETAELQLKQNLQTLKKSSNVAPELHKFANDLDKAASTTGLYAAIEAYHGGRGKH